MLNNLRVLPMFIKDVPSPSLTHLRISMAKLLFIGYVPPIILAVSTILWTWISDFEASTYTHCGVTNIVPSMSAVIQAHQLSWVLVTWLHLPFRPLAVWLYCRYFRRLLPPDGRPLGWLFFWFLIQHSISLVPLVQYINLKGPVLIHYASALSCWFSSCGLMITLFLRLKRYRRELNRPHEQLSYLLKQKLAITCSVTMVIMWPFYLLHTKFCLPFAYSVFSLCEYVLTLGTMGYLLTTFLDFYPVYICYNAQLGFHLTDI